MTIDQRRPPALIHPRPRGGWFLRGVRNCVSTPALVLMAAVFGFGGLARAAGFDMLETAFMTGMIWALPSQLVLVGSVASGAGLAGSALAVALSAVRLTPMTVALVPILRGPRTRRIVLFALSHFIAVTAWVEGMRHLPSLPREARVPYFVGFGGSLMLGGVLSSMAGHAASGALPPLFSAGLLLLTPAYFTIALVNAATSVAERAAMALGLAFGPLAALTLPGPDVVWSGLAAGTLAYLIDRRTRRRAKP